MCDLIVMICLSQEKLEEAKFFLNNLEKNSNRIPDKDYYLSAFISSSRSISWIMKAEFGNYLWWPDWKAKKDNSDDTKTLFKNINDLRIRAEKISPLHTGDWLEFKIPPEYVTDEIIRKFESIKGKSGILSVFDSPPENCLDAVPYIGMEYKKSNVTEIDSDKLLSTCREYLAILEKLVNECIENTNKI